MSESSGGGRKRWLMVLEAVNGPGVMLKIAAVFSGRGVSMDAIFASTAWVESQPVALVSATFEATERRRRMLERVLSRLAPVLRVSVHELDHPEADLAQVALAVAEGAPETFSAASSVPGVGLLVLSEEAAGQGQIRRRVALAGRPGDLAQALGRLRRDCRVIEEQSAVFASLSRGAPATDKPRAQAE